MSPTDRILVSAMLERETVPRRLRQLLRIESGLNDGIASPIAMVLLDGRGLGAARVAGGSVVRAEGLCVAAVCHHDAAAHLFQAIAFVIVLSIVAHSSSDVPIIRGFARAAQRDKR